MWLNSNLCMGLYKRSVIMSNINNYSSSQDLIKRLKNQNIINKNAQDNQEETLDYQTLTNSNFIKNVKNDNISFQKYIH